MASILPAPPDVAANTGKKVLIAIPVLLLGGTEIHTLLMVRALVSAGYRVSICCYYEYELSMASRFEDAGARVLLLKLERDRGLFGPARMAMLIYRLLMVFRQERPDIIHVQYIAPGLLPVIAARLMKVRTVFATVHIAGKVAYGLKAKAMLRLAARLCTAFFCVSKGVEEFWFGNSMTFDSSQPGSSRKHFTIYNGIDVDRIAHAVNRADVRQLRQSFGVAGNPAIGIVGRLARQKGHVVLLEALTRIAATLPEVVLIIIGDGPERAVLRDKAKALGIERNIVWLGSMSQEKVYKTYSIMNVLAMPSIYEGFGLVAAEAMAAGLPIVGTRVDGLSELIEDRITGYLVSPGNAEELANALLNLLQDKEKAGRFGTAGRTRVRRDFSREAFDNSVVSAYRRFAHPRA